LSGTYKYAAPPIWTACQWLKAMNLARTLRIVVVLSTWSNRTESLGNLCCQLLFPIHSPLNEGIPVENIFQYHQANGSSYVGLGGEFVNEKLFHLETMTDIGSGILLTEVYMYQFGQMTQLRLEVSFQECLRKRNVCHSSNACRDAIICDICSRSMAID